MLIWRSIHTQAPHHTTSAPAHARQRAAHRPRHRNECQGCAQAGQCGRPVDDAHQQAHDNQDLEGSKGKSGVGRVAVAMLRDEVRSEDTRRRQRVVPIGFQVPTISAALHTGWPAGGMLQHCEARWFTRGRSQTVHSRAATVLSTQGQKQYCPLVGNLTWKGPDQTCREVGPRPGF